MRPSADRGEAMASIRPPVSGSGDEPEISIVVPLYNEADNIPELHRRVSEALQDSGESYELVLVDDGSRDATPELADELHEADERVVVVHLSRNFGHQAAVSAGIDHARGRAVVLMDGDLQDPPEVIDEFLRAWRAGNDVVYAIRTKRKECLWKRSAYALFYRLLHTISDLDVPLDSGDFCLMDRQVVDALKALPERGRFVRGLRTFVGFRQVGIRYERDPRQAGTSKYGFFALLRLAVDGLVGFSGYPLTLVTQLGIASLLLAVGLTAWVLMDAYWHHTAPRGWASLIVVVLYMSSMQLFSLGIIAEYIRRIFIEAKGRPTYVVRTTRGLPVTALESSARRLRPLTEDGLRSYTTPVRRTND
jgi:dolichol-phosphate mannosyltransferase